MNKYSNVINGNSILAILYLFIILVFITEIYLYKNYPCRENCPKTTPHQLKKWMKVIRLYLGNVLFVVDIIFLIILMVSSTITKETISFRFIALFALLIAVFILLFISKRTVFNPKGFDSNAINHEIDAVYHVIAAQIFVLAVPAISLPSLWMMQSGLTFGLILCFIIVIQTIIDPTVLIHRSKKNVKKDAFQLVKGMVVIVFCIWVILYLMVYCCWRTNPGYYYSANGGIDSMDLLYYMFVSFSTIGFGDIVPVRVDGFFFSRAIAIIISITGFVISSCFIGAVVSGISTLSSNATDDEIADEDTLQKSSLNKET